MSASPNRTLDQIAAGALLVGAVFGLGGTLVASPTLQASLWAIDSVALVVATSLLALRFFRAGSDVVAAGFLVFAIGEGVLLSGTAAGPAASVPARRIYAGQPLLPTASPLPFFAYPFLVATLLGWAWTLVRTRA